MADSLDKARKIINEIDREMAELFVKRMRTVEMVAEYKKERGLPILDGARESEVISRNSAFVEDETLCEYYVKFLRDIMAISREYQDRLVEGNAKISIGRGLISRAGEIFNLKRRVLIVTDTGIPRMYAKTVKACCQEARIITIPEGEGSKSIDCLTLILSEMLNFSMTRTDCLIAVGGGVVGDIAGFAAASFMRGVDFYNIPTTLLSQVDASIGGKTAIDFLGVKNVVGAFYQPKGVIIDPNTLTTLPKRQISNGLAEVIKMSLTSDRELFELIENTENTEDIIDEIIAGSIKIKKTIVEADEREGGIRKILNFGHTLGHGIEAAEMGKLYHGECVALGMLPLCSGKVRERLIPILKRFGLPTEYSGDIEHALSFIGHDKKSDGGKISVIFVDEIGSCRIEKMDTESFASHVLKELK